jgi:hypothetical protein
MARRNKSAPVVGNRARLRLHIQQIRKTGKQPAKDDDYKHQQVDCKEYNH